MKNKQQIYIRNLKTQENIVKITNELFVIPSGKQFILFAPLKGSLLEVNETTVALLQECNFSGYFPEGEVYSSLLNAGIIFEGEDICHKLQSRPKSFEPSGVTLFPTSDCNALCTYCYGAAGETHYYLPWQAAKAAIDLVFTNTLKHHSKKTLVGFHGGGEPFYGKAWPLVKQATNYAQLLAKRHKIFVSISAASNGVLSLKQLEWIIMNMGNLNISLDGPENIQNHQRPLKTGQPSYPYVMRTIKYLEEHNFSYGIRATITNESVQHLIEIVDFFHSISSLKRFHFEPLFECGRCKTTGAEAPNPIIFATAMIEAMQYAKKMGIEIYYSGSCVDKVVDSFCGASGRSFCVTPQGYVTSCFEVSLDSDPRAAKFFFGKYDAIQKKFIFEQPQLNFLKRRNIFNLPHCGNCFIKYQCAGDCLAKIDATGDMFDTSKNSRCEINQMLSLYKMNELLQNKVSKIGEERSIQNG